ILDVDGEAGRTSLAALEANHGPLPTTRAVATGRRDGGEHRWFILPPGVTARCTAGALGAGLDTRASGGYTILPPSNHASGKASSWLESCQPAVLPKAWELPPAG